METPWSAGKSSLRPGECELTERRGGKSSLSELLKMLRERELILKKFQLLVTRHNI